MRRAAARAFGLMLAVLVSSGTALGASATGWDHVGDGGTPGSRSLDAPVLVLHDTAGALYAGGSFTNAGGIAAADYLAAWNGSAWSAIGAPPLNGAVSAIASAGGKLYVGGSFTDAGGISDADHLAVWDGATWGTVCTSTGPAFAADVDALEVIGSTIYVGGAFQDGAGLASADYLVGCDLATGVPSTTVIDPAHPFNGPVRGLAADGTGRLYAGGSFSDLENLAAADNVAMRDGTGWHALGVGALPGGAAVSGTVRSLSVDGAIVYVGSDATDIAGIAQADHVARWNGAAWSALGANTAGDDGWLPAAATINAITTEGANVFATGSFVDAKGDPTADHIAVFSGTSWHALGSNGNGGGSLDAAGSALASFGQRLYGGGSFTSAGGDPLAQRLASYVPPAAPAPPVPPAPTTIDSDGDGSPAGSDCNDANPAQRPGAVDVPGNGVDEDCSGADTPVAPKGATRGNDVLVGTRFANRICGLAGRDLISGGAGDDTLFGDACGSINGPGGNDRLLGQAGNDRLYGAGGNDVLDGGLGADRLFGGPGNDLLLPGSGRDVVSAGAGNDRVFARDRTRDVVDCGAGRSDRAVVDLGDVVRHCEHVARR